MTRVTLRLLSIGTGALAVVGSLASCSAGSTPAPPPSTPQSTAPTPAPSTPTPATGLVHPTPDVDRWKPIAFLDEQAGSNSVGTYDRAGHILYVDLYCMGGASVDIDVIDVGTFPVPCSPDGTLLSHNEFEVGFVDTLSVSIVATESQKWAITLSEPG